MTLLRLLALATVLFVAACSPGSDHPHSAISLADCRLPGVETVARCGLHEVWEDRESKTGHAAPRHDYSLADYGLTEDQVRKAFDR